MKRFAIISVLLSMVFGLVAFQCSSTELTSAKLYIQQKNLPKAKEELLKEVKKNPKADEGYYLLGYVYAEEGNFKNMIQSYEKSLQISNKYEKSIKDSRKYYWAKNFNNGVMDFNKAAKAKNKESQKKFFINSISKFKNAIICEPDSVASYKDLVYSYLNLGRTNDAIAPLIKIKELDNSADAYLRLGQIYYSDGINAMNNYYTTKNVQDSLKAIGYYNKVIKILEEGRKFYPNNSKILLILSNAYINAKEINVAKSIFKAGVEKEPNNKIYHYNYGVLLLNSNDYQDAAKQFKEALRIDSSYKNAIYNLGVTYVKWGAHLNEIATAKNIEDTTYKNKYRLALPYLENYLKLEPNEGKIWNILGKVYANLGMNKKSEKAFDKADKLNK